MPRFKLEKTFRSSERPNAKQRKPYARSNIFDGRLKQVLIKCRHKQKSEIDLPGYKCFESLKKPKERL